MGKRAASTSRKSAAKAAEQDEEPEVVAEEEKEVEEAPEEEVEEDDEDDDEDDSDDDDDDDDDDEDEEEEDDEDDDEEEEEVEKAEAPKKSVSAKAKAKAKAKGKAKAKAKAGAAKRRKTGEDEGDLSEKEDVEKEEEEVLDPDEVVARAMAQVVQTRPEAEDPTKPKSRLMIKQIVLENFKSYGGRKLIGPFNKSFSSIVGPNGSGKSNTIDALLFVFGKRAKKMRLNKVSELIHASTGMQNLNSARVEVTFQDIIDTGDGPQDYEIVEGSELTVAREAFRNNTSKYSVDGKSSNFTEVNILLRKRGVDLEHNRFLILQGEVEQISLMKPKALTPHEDGLLEYLEDIIGSNRYVEPIQQVEGVVEALTETRTEKLNRLRVAEREKDSLDGPRKEAEAWVTAEAERLELQSLAAQSEAWRSHASVKGLEDEHKVLQKHMEEHKKKMEVYEKDVKAIEGKHNENLKDYNSIKAQMEKAALDFKEFERQDVKYTEDIQFHEQKLQKITQTMEKEKADSTKLVEEAKRLREEAPTREKELESAERFKASVSAKLEKVYESLKGKAEELRPEKEAKEAELVPLQKRLTEVRKVVEVAQTEAQLLREKTTKISEQISEMKKQRTECESRFKVRDQEAKEAGKVRKDRAKLIDEARARLQGVAKAVEESTQEVAATRVKAEEAKSAFQDEHFRGRLIRAVYEQSKAGKLKGVHGRLGDLGTIPKKYDVAVSTACGMLDAIVVDTTEDAQKVIEFIRREELGRTTCICLEKIKHKEREIALSRGTPEGAPRLIDLIKPAKPEYQVAFFFALHHTLVAKDLEQATRIGLQGSSRWRVVTLDGKLIDTSGTMSGGGHQVAKGGMRASLCAYSPEEVKELVDAYEQANAKLTAARQEKRALEEAVQLTEKEVAEYDVKEKKCSMEAESLKKQVEAYDARLAQMKVPTLSSGEKSKVKELEKLIASHSEELTEVQDEHRLVEEEVRRLHDQIMNIGGEELRVAKQKVEDATKKCDDMRRYNKKALLDADNMDKNAKKALENAKGAVEEQKNTEKALKKLKEEHAKLDDKAEAVLNSYNQMKESLAEKDKVLNVLREQRDQIIAEASALKSQEVDLVNELEEKTRLLRDHLGRITAWGNKLKEARAEYKELPLDILKDLRAGAEEPSEEAEAAAEPGEASKELSRRAIAEDLGAEDLGQVVRGDIDARMLILEQNLRNLKPNLTSIEEFRRADTEHKARLADYEEVNEKREEQRRKLETLRQSRLEEFMDGFSIISMKLKEMYQMITLGGDAELELVDTLDPFSEGINFSVRPPKKSWKQITNLSGGEKTLASLSLVFALHHFRPTPLYFMDEIDAALDFRNVSIIANYIKERTKNAQFIVISLRNHMFEMADLLVGIYKTMDVSKSVAVNPLAFEVSKPPLQDMSGNAGSQAAIGGLKRPAPQPLEGPPSQVRRVAAGKEN